MPESDAVAYEGAEIFSTHCAGCHTISAAGTQGSANRALRVQGPNFDQRTESYDEALYAIHNGGFSGAIMPQNIVAGEDATKVAKFLEAYSGTDVIDPPRPTSNPQDEQGAGTAVPDVVGNAESSAEDTSAGSDTGQDQLQQSTSTTSP